jgi:glycine cleavage system H protein
VAGEVVAVNEELEGSPDLVNKDPYGAGWMIRVKPEDPAQMEELLDKNAYLEHLKGMES